MRQSLRPAKAKARVNPNSQRPYREISLKAIPEVGSPIKGVNLYLFDYAPCFCSVPGMVFASHTVTKGLVAEKTPYSILCWAKPSCISFACFLKYRARQPDRVN